MNEIKNKKKHMSPHLFQSKSLTEGVVLNIEVNGNLYVCYLQLLLINLKSITA